MKYLITTLTFLLLGFTILAQVGQPPIEPPKIFPTSPEAASLGKYGEIPVNLSTGRMNHTIPLHTINEAGFSLPISLSYNYSGLMVDELPGATGLGWDFSGKGMITRQVRGLADESQLGYIGPNEIGKKVHKFHTDSQNMTPEELGLLIRESAAGKWDTESDKYMISVGSLSATFYFNHNGEAVFAPYKNYKLTRLFGTQGNFKGFKLIDDAGVNYFFELQETTEIETLSATEPTITMYPSAWVITKIELPNTKTITFEYQNYTVRQRTYSDAWTIVDIDSPEYTRCIQEQSLNRVSHSYSDNTTEGLLVNKIITPSETVTFNYTTYTAVNIDKNPTSLDAVTIKNTIGQEVMTYTLTYTDKTATRKLLTAIDRGRTNASQQKNYYRFEYYGSPAATIAYYKQDYWGYYSGSTNNTGSLISENSNRSPDFNSTRQGALRKIHYPTKGYSEFIYEQNQVFGKLDTGEIGSEARLDVKIDTVITSDRYPLNENINKTITIPFTPKVLPGGEGIKVSLGYYLHTSMGYSLALVELKKVGGGVVSNCPGQGICNYKYEASSAEQEPVTKQQDPTLYSLEAGDYELVVQLERIAAPSNPDRTPRAVANVQLKYYSGTPPPEPEVINIPFGGLRIKEVNSYDSQGGHTTKRYSYMKEDGITSSGINLSKPVFVNKESYHYLPDLTPPGRAKMDCNLTKRSSSSTIPLSTYIGSPVLYTTVEEQLVGDANEMLKTRSYFSGTKNLEESYPYAPIEQSNWRKGLVKKQESYIKNASAYDVNGITTNIYNKLERHLGALSHLNSFNLKAGKVRYVFDADGNLQTSTSGVNNSEWTRYVNRSELYPIASSKQEEIHHSKTISKDVTYTYDDPYGQLKTQTTTISNQATVATNYSYPYDKNSTVNNALVTQNRITTPIEIQNIEAGDVLSTQTTEFVDWGNGILLPGITKVAKGTDTPEPRLTYHKYDSKGNPLEVSQADGRHIMYVWGYNNTQPIVKIVNASYTGISSTASSLITQLQTASNTEDTVAEEVTMRNLFKDLRGDAYFADAQITGYTYDPLVGATSMTDPKGYTGYYQYDEFNRLTYGLDDDQHIVQQIRYNYQGEQTTTLGDVTISTSLSAIQPNQAVTFTANTSGSEGADLYTWSVDGTQEQCDSTTSFTKTFASEGTYTVSVIAYNTQTKHRVSKTMSVVVAYPPITTPIVSANYTNIVKGTNVTFTASSVGGGTGNLRYEWYVNNVKQTSTATTLVYNPGTAGTYNVYFKVIDNTSGKTVNSAIRKLYAYNPLTAANVSASKSHIVQGTTTTFFASGIGGGTGLQGYEWFINDVQQSATGTTLSYNFPNSGTYTVKFRLVDRGLENGYYQWGANAPVVKSYPGMVANTSQSHTSISGTNPSVSFNITSLTGGSGSRQISWKAYNSINLSHALGSGSGTSFGFSNFSNGTHEYTIKATITDNLTGQQITKVMIVVATVTTGGGGGGGNTGEQH
ncbi:PKD domain-containing protein [Aquimarina megaterium]|uniref:PKD domain-containing protein n=1 Tax=Aquimarina megaterium TaxID=1443666 RepID=UPI000942ECB4|nr:PKD domain-containing protein [Aquimarina megaterium]